MWTHHLTTLYRSLTRHRLYAAINVLGLAVGIAVFLALGLYVRFETSFERWIPNADQIYPMRQTWHFAGRAAEAHNFTMGGLLEELETDFPQVTGTRMWNQPATVRQGGRASQQLVSLVDPGFLDTFHLPLVVGDRATLLRTPDQALLSRSAARKYFGTDSAMGRRLSLSMMGELHDYRVTGVLADPPKSTDFDFSVVIPITPEMISVQRQPYWNHWGSSQTPTYLRFPTPQAARVVNAQLDAFVDRRGRADMGGAKPPHTLIHLEAIPLLGSHLIEPADRAVVATLGVVGVLTLLLAAVNYVNLATARAGLRAREVAVRKVMGATSRDLVVQFLAEAVATVAVAALLGLALTEIALPLVNAAGGLSLKLEYFGRDGVVAPLLCGTMGVGLAAGAYPALALSRFRAAAVLASARTPGGGRAGSRVREVLVTAQFAVAIAFTVATAVILAQSRHLHQADLGFRRTGAVVVKSFDNPDVTASQRSTLLFLWRTLPGVASITTADIGPGVDEAWNATMSKRPGVTGDGVSTTYVETGPDFFATYGARFLAGRPLDRDHGLDDAAPLFSAGKPEDRALRANRLLDVVLSRTAVRALGFASPQDAVGKPILSALEGNTLRPLKVVGVVDDLRMRTPHEPVPNTYYFMRTDDIPNATAGVRFEGADPQAVIDQLQASWRRVASAVPFQAVTAQQSLQDYYTTDDQRGRLFTIGAVLAVVIGCVGLYGLASFTTARRIREIGIRKTLGASTGDILRLLVGQFLRPVLLANLVAWPLAYVAVRNWLSGFDQRIALSPLYFVGATALTLAVALLTVIGQALLVARAEPARALRHE